MSWKLQMYKSWFFIALEKFHMFIIIQTFFSISNLEETFFLQNVWMAHLFFAKSILKKQQKDNKII